MVSQKEDMKCQQSFVQPHQFHKHFKNHFYFAQFHPCKPLKNYLFLFAMNSPTAHDADGRDSHKIGGDKRSKISAESGGRGNDK